MIADVERHDDVELSPVERLLVATDGTVTHMLEALTRGEVIVDILDREVAGTTLDRRVVLRRAADGSHLVWARSAVDLSALDPGLADALVSGDIGIGTLLRDECAETRRELVDVQATRYDADDMPSFIEGHASLFLERTYLIYHDGDRIMTITEYFPKGLF